jgi:hypothetical protein
MPSTAMIPTFRKTQISRGFTYPIGAMELSSLLSDVPGFDQCEIWFRDRGTYWASDYQKVLKDKGEILALEFTDDNWRRETTLISIKVYAVPTDFGVITREQLLTNLRDPIRKWFNGVINSRPTFKLNLNLSNGKCRIIQ